MATPRASDILGHVTLVTGPEEFLNQRTVSGGRGRGARRRPRVRGERDHGRPGQHGGAGRPGRARRCSPRSAASCCGASRTCPRTPTTGSWSTPRHPSEDIGLVLVHAGGQKGSGLLTRLRKLAGRHRGEVGLAASRRSSPASSPPRSAAHGGRIAEDAADLLVQAVGQDLRALAARRRPAGQRLPRRAADGVGRAEVLRRPRRGEVLRDRRRGASRAAPPPRWRSCAGRSTTAPRRSW